MSKRECKGELESKRAGEPKEPEEPQSQKSQRESERESDRDR